MCSYAHSITLKHVRMIIQTLQNNLDYNIIELTKEVTLIRLNYLYMIMSPF